MASATTINLDTGRGPEPIEVDASLTITIDPADLGRHIAGMSSAEQAAVILGFYEDIADGQIRNIGADGAWDASPDPDLRADVARVLRMLVEAIEKGA